MDSVDTKKMNTDEERRLLAERLDRELEEYINSLEKRSSHEVWPEDRWQEEMEKHPFFMTKVPESGEIPPLLQGLQELKYSPEENSPEDLAKAYKEDGNYHYKLKKYRMAILSYTEGIKQRSNDVELNGHLYNNRAAAHYYLGNYRSCYNDCKCALRTLPLYTKAINRLAYTSFKLGLYDECIQNCEIIGEDDRCTKDILDLKKDAFKKKKEKEREGRRENILKKKALFESKKLMEAITERGITLAGKGRKENDESLTDISSDMLPGKVHLKDNLLIWPVLLLYPEYETSDIIENFCEHHTFQDELTEIFSTFADWDVEHKYTLNNINIYYENIEGNIKLVDYSSTLGSVISNKDFRVENGTPTFLILAKGSHAEKRVLNVQK